MHLVVGLHIMQQRCHFCADLLPNLCLSQGTPLLGSHNLQALTASVSQTTGLCCTALKLAVMAGGVLLPEHE